MNEIEVKVLDADNESIKKDIIKNGGILVKKELQENYMYELPPCTKNRNGFIRIRKIHDLLRNKDKAILCSKKITSQDKTRQNDENELEVDFNDCKKFIDSLDLNFISIQKKYRESYKFNNTLIEFDTWDKSIYEDTYIEIEGPDSSSIYKTLKLLNIPSDKVTSMSLQEIIKEQQKHTHSC